MSVFADEFGSFCGDCQLKHKVKYCPRYMRICKYWTTDELRQNSHKVATVENESKSVDKTIDRELE